MFHSNPCLSHTAHTIGSQLQQVLQHEFGSITRSRLGKLSHRLPDILQRIVGNRFACRIPQCQRLLLQGPSRRGHELAKAFQLFVIVFQQGIETPQHDSRSINLDHVILVQFTNESHVSEIIPLNERRLILPLLLIFDSGNRFLHMRVVILFEFAN